MQWDQRYSEPGYAYGIEPNDFLVEMIDHVVGTKVLSLAEGEGRNACFMAARGLQVTAVDASAVGLQKAQQLARERGVVITTVVHDLTDFDAGIAQWDAVVSIFCHLPPAQRASLHRRVVQALKPGGVLILEAYTPRQLEFGSGGPPSAGLMMTAEALRDELQGLDLLHAQETERDVIEGRYHHGRAAVVQVLARKDPDV